MVIGVTGRSGSGKTTYADRLSEKTGYPVIHVDEISHQVMELPQVKSALIDAFGEQVVKEGLVDRKFLGDIIFSNRHEYKKMTDIVWNEIKARINNEMVRHDSIVIEWILLPHTSFWKLCDRKILIEADEKLRKEMVLKRDNISPEYLEKRDAAGINYDGIVFDQVVYNDYRKEGK